MKIETNEKSEIILKEVFSGIGLETPSGETLNICMRDGGFEFSYGNKWHRAVGGKIEVLGCIKPCGMNYCDENGGRRAFNEHLYCVQQ